MTRNKFLLIMAIAINNFGDIIFDLFIVWSLGIHTGDVMNAVYVIGTSVAFRAFLSFFVGSIIDKHKKKKMMIISHVLSILVIGCFGLLWGLAKQWITVGIAFVLLNDINNELFTRSYVSMVSTMLDENQYIKFQSYSNIISRIISIGGATIAGVLIDNISEKAIFAIDTLTYIIALILIMQVNYSEKGLEARLKQHICTKFISDVKYTISTILHSSFLRAFIMLMFILNLAYGFIPQILPVFKTSASDSATLLGLLKSSITIGEIVGFVAVSKLSRYVSSTFKISMILNVFIMIGIYLTEIPYILIVLFAAYGFSDSLTQPLFGYTVSHLDSDNRGKLLGGIDAIIMFSPSIGIYLISIISSFNKILGGMILSAIFLMGFIIVVSNKNMKHIVLRE